MRAFQAYNKLNGTDYTQETWDAEKSEAVAAWKQGYLAIGLKIHAMAEGCRDAAKQLKQLNTQKAEGAVIVYEDIATMLEGMI